MDLRPHVLSLCVMMTCLIGAVRCSNPDECCPPISQLPQTELIPNKTICFQDNQTFRYKCIGGYVRKAGTSNLIRCQKDDHHVLNWTLPILQCIRDPKTTKPPMTKTTESPSDIPTTTITAASTSLQMTLSVSTSASVTAETHSTEPTSPGLQDTSNHSQGETRTTATDWTTSTSTTTKPSNNGTANPYLTEQATVGIACASLVTVCALIGIIFLCHKRRSTQNIPLHTAEEQLPMNHAPSAPVL